jgi:DNA mismatch endonuclease (patch repair protein)
VRRADPLSPTQRSERMGLVAGKRNRSTELRVEQILRANGVRGWTKHPTDVSGRPDFYFPRRRLAVFVDGCFWHKCPTCNRRLPSSRAHFWRAKLSSNRARDQRVTRKLRQGGFHVMRVWEHALAKPGWLARLRRMLLGCPARGGACSRKASV